MPKGNRSKNVSEKSLQRKLDVRERKIKKLNVLHPLRWAAGQPLIDLASLTRRLASQGCMLHVRLRENMLLLVASYDGSLINQGLVTGFDGVYIHIRGLVL